MNEAEAKRILRGHNFTWIQADQEWVCTACGFKMQPRDPAFTCGHANDAPKTPQIIDGEAVEVVDTIRPLPPSLPERTP